MPSPLASSPHCSPARLLASRLLPALLLLLAVALLPGTPAQAQTSPTKIGPAAKLNKSERQASPPLTSLPPPKAGGPRRILLVDDDWNGNNKNEAVRPSGSDRIFRELVAAAVRGDARAWSSEMVETYQHGPTFERLRDYNVILWYTGESYGGSADSVSTLSVEDEKTVRRYLEEVGGSVILISPGLLTTRAYGTTWTESENPFLKEVVGINGFASLAQRFKAGTVTAADGSAFEVEAKGAIETQFSTVNPDGAAVIFRSPLGASGKAEDAAAVAVAHPYGSGRFVYVGFSLENIAEASRAKAFGLLLDAATGATTSPTPASTLRLSASSQATDAGTQRLLPPPAAPAGPPVTDLEISSSYPSSHSLRWIATLNTGIDSFEVYRRDRDGWKFLKGGFRESFYTDIAFVAPGSAYKVVAVYQDGRRGEAVVEYPNPPQPGCPTGLRAAQTGPEKVQVDWVNVPGVGKYRVHYPGAPAAGTPVTTGTLGDPGYGGRTSITLPVGIHEIRLVAEYGAGPSPLQATTRVAVNQDRGRYRLVFLGVKVNTAVNDDIIDADGRGNEIYAAAYWATAHPTLSEPATQGGFARTLVLGDTTNFPARVRAGTAGPTGGLRAGDFVPSSNAQLPQPGVAATTDRFPLKLWEGELVEGGPIVGVIPILFEWNAANHSAWDYWANYWSSGGNILQQLAEAMRANPNTPLASQPLHGTWTVQDFSKAVDEKHEERPNIPGFTVAADRDRPIGLINTNTPGTMATYGHKTVGFALTRKRVETALSGQPCKLLQTTWSDAASGNYTGYFQLERLSEPPLVVPPASAEPTATPVMATGTLAVQPVIATVTPALPAAPPPTPTPPTTSAPEPTLKRPLPGDRTATGRLLTPPPEPPAGPPPTNLMISSEHPARHMVRWQGGTGATFSVFRKQGEQWVTVSASTTFTQAVDKAFVAPGTLYRVEANYPDGRRGRAELAFATPSQPAVVTELKMTQTGERKVKLSWKWTSGTSIGFRVFAPGQPAGGTPVALTDYSGTMTHELTNVPEGTQLFRVAYEYEGMTAPVETQLRGTVAAWSGHYRAVLLGFRVGRKSVDDDIFDGDGRGDELFFAAYRAMVTNPGAGTIAPLGAVQSAVHGDTARFPGRVQAGTASSTGGIRSGDIVPSEAALTAQPGIAAMHDRLPMLLWEGTLRNDGGALALALAAFEWDNNSPAPFNSWTSWWDAPNGRNGLLSSVRSELSASPRAIRFQPFALTYEVEPDKPLIEDRLAIPPPSGVPKEQRYVAYLYYGRPMANRPIGVLKSVDPKLWYYVPQGFTLTRGNVEAALGTANAVVISGSLTMHRGPGTSKPAEEDEAEYTVYLQIERTGPAPGSPP